MNERAILGAMVGLGCFLLESVARADELRADWSVNKATQGDEWDGGYDVKAERRSGFTGAYTLGIGAIAAQGYPNEVEKLDKKQYRSSTGIALGTLDTIWLGGALRDWFVFGLGIYGLNTRVGDVKAAGGGFLFHIEAFPLFPLGGRYRDLSVYSNLGLGGLTIKGGPEKADGGIMSLLTLGAHFELLKLRYFALGPSLEGVYTYSQYAQGGGGTLGVRAAFYTGP